MSGRRCKALLKAFVARHGRPPGRIRWIGWDRYVPSEWRRLKKAHNRAVSTSRTFRPERAVTAAHRDEVRRFVKRDARKRRRAA